MNLKETLTENQASLLQEVSIVAPDIPVTLCCRLLTDDMENGSDENNCKDICEEKVGKEERKEGDMD